MPRGRPKKCSHNTTGLRNQKPSSLPEIAHQSSSGEEPQLGTAPEAHSNQSGDGEEPEEDELLWLRLRDEEDMEEVERWDEEDLEGIVSDEEVSFESDDLWEGDELQENLILMAMEAGDDPTDEDWLPHELRKRKRLKLGRPKEYTKGPDVMSKSACTQRRYRAKMKNQQKLTSFGFMKEEKGPADASGFFSGDEVVEVHRESAYVTEGDSDTEVVEVHGGSTAGVTGADSDVEVLEVYGGPSGVIVGVDSDIEAEGVGGHGSSSGAIGADSDDEESVGVAIPPRSPSATTTGTASRAVSEVGEDEDEDISEEPEYAWEEDLEDAINPASNEIRGWDVLREQIKRDLQRGSKTLPISQVNQLLIIRNFATLRLKGLKKIEASERVAQQWHEENGAYFSRKIRALAHHYQVFEQLPKETRGGTHKARTLLADERVKKGALDWLNMQTAGEVTPKRFREALNTVILPTLLINLTKPLSERTARRWLLKLGWRVSVLRKGVYMDGHERADVVEYRQNVFLPLMEKYERRMAKYEGPDLNYVPPTLEPGEKEVIPNFQDESCLTVNEYKSHAW